MLSIWEYYSINTIKFLEGFFVNYRGGCTDHNLVILYVVDNLLYCRWGSWWSPPALCWHLLLQEAPGPPGQGGATSSSQLRSQAGQEYGPPIPSGQEYVPFYASRSLYGPPYSSRSRIWSSLLKQFRNPVRSSLLNQVRNMVLLTQAGQEYCPR